jgi:hypothetical protein
MKTFKFILAAAAVAVGLTFFLTKCKKNTEIVVVTVHDTIRGKSISGLCTYPNFSSTFVKAKGAVVSLYLGSTMTGNPVATAYADTNGNYILPYLLPNTYYLYARYNTDNNYKLIEGIDFHTDGTSATFAVTITNANVVKNLILDTEAPTGTKIIKMTASSPTCTTCPPQTIDSLALDSHSSLTWWSTYCGDASSGMGGTENTMEGHFGQIPGYGASKVTKFYFDEANPANTYFQGWVRLSLMSTNEPGRDGLPGQPGTSGCVGNTLQLDTVKTGTTITAVPITDTAWYTVNAGQVIKYGKGYLCHGTMTAFYKSAAGEIEPPRTYSCTVDSGSWNGFGPKYLGPYSTRITKQVDMYLEYQGAKTTWNATHTTFNKWAIFEATMDWDRKDFFVKNTSIGRIIHVTPHLQFKGNTNVNW